MLLVTYGLVRYVFLVVFWHIFTKPFAWARRAFVWSGEAYYHTV
jgi:hypothetical protein